MLRRNGFTLVELMIVVAIIGILAAIAIPNFINMRQRADEAVVRANVHTVQLTAELFAAQNNGNYAAAVDQDIGFGSMVDELPSGQLLTNPFTHILDSPTDGFATLVGECGYMPQDGNGDGVFEGYIVTGFGAAAEVLRIVIAN